MSITRREWTMYILACRGVAFDIAEVLAEAHLPPRARKRLEEIRDRLNGYDIPDDLPGPGFGESPPRQDKATKRRINLSPEERERRRLRMRDYWAKRKAEAKP